MRLHSKDKIGIGTVHKASSMRSIVYVHHIHLMINQSATKIKLNDSIFPIIENIRNNASNLNSRSSKVNVTFNLVTILFYDSVKTTQ